MRNSAHVNNSNHNVNSTLISSITSHIPNSEFPNKLGTMMTCIDNRDCITRPEFAENPVFGSQTIPSDTIRDSRLVVTAQAKDNAEKLDSQMGCHSNQNFSEKQQTHDFIAVFADFPELDLFDCEYKQTPTISENEFITISETEPIREQCITIQSPCVGVLTVCQAHKATIGSQTKLASQNETL